VSRKKQEGFHAIIIPHTHWDREWYSTFQNFRSRLVIMMDNLLEILAKDPAFTCFTFDGQVIPFEDYLEVRPERREDIRKYVKAGRIEVGPYYVLPDNYLVSGEAHIRNLLLGMRMSEDLGKVMKVGYIPDAFGQIAQTPQILQGFGIDSAVFFRGVGNEGDRLKSEFIWQAPDQESSVLTHWLIDGYGTLEKVSEDMKSALSQLGFAVKRFLVKASTHNVLLMNGMDHVEAQPHIPLVVKQANQKSTDGTFKIGTLSEFFEAVRKDKPEFVVYQGEFRGAKYTNVTPGVTSTRTYLKQKNVEMEILLERWAEPFDAWVWSLGGRHNHGLIWRAWKYILQCHPHDSICGCGIDPIHDEMMRRFKSAQQLGEAVVQKDLSSIASNVNVGPDEYAIVVFNPLAWSRTDIVEATILTSKSTEKFELFDPEDKSVLFSVVDERIISKAYSSKFKEKVFDIALLAENVPPCGYKTYRVRPFKEKEEKRQDVKKADNSSSIAVRGKNVVENEFFRVQVETNGSITLLDKATETSYRGFNIFEDVGDVGDEYNYSPPKHDKTYSSENLTARVTPCASGSAICTLKIEYDLMLPIGVDNDRQTRSTTLVSCPAFCYVSLYPGVPRVDFRLELVNSAKDHRLRVLFPTGMKCEHSYADQAFHVIERSLELPDAKNWTELPMPTYPMQSYVSAGDGKNGATVTTRGLHEYEVKKDGTIAITLLRCVGWLSREDLTTREATAGPIIQTPDAQCLGRQTFFYSVISHRGTWETGKAFVQAMQHQAPMRTVQVLDHEFATLGEWALVSTEFKDPVVKKSQKPLRSSPYPLGQSYLSVEPSSVILSAVKRAEDGSGIIVRFYNTTSQTVEAKLTFYRKITEATLVNMREEPRSKNDENKEACHVRGRQVSFEARPYKVNTLKLKME
jgi:mannosylglycerate hydrolase